MSALGYLMKISHLKFFTVALCGLFFAGLCRVSFSADLGVEGRFNHNIALAEISPSVGSMGIEDNSPSRTSLRAMVAAIASTSDAGIAAAASGFTIRFGNGLTIPLKYKVRNGAFNQAPNWGGIVMEGNPVYDPTNEYYVIEKNSFKCPTKNWKHAVYAACALRGAVSGNYFEGSMAVGGSFAVQVRRGRPGTKGNLLITKNVFINDGIHVGNEKPESQLVCGVIISDNTFNNSGALSSNKCAVSMGYPVDDSLISSNRFYNHRVLISSGGNSLFVNKNNEISHNTFVNSVVVLSETANTKVHQNSFRDDPLHPYHSFINCIGKNKCLQIDGNYVDKGNETDWGETTCAE
jgi:hypothetical protein